jgi:hypothetical protein
MTKRILTLMLALAFCLTVPVNAANIIWVSDGYDDNADGASDDLEWVSILEAAGYTVDYQINALGDGYWRTLDDDKIAALNAADCIIVSRNSDSGSYDDGDEIAQWNAVTAPLILCSTHIIRSSRWNWVNSTSILSLTPTMVLADGTELPGIDENVGPGSFIDADPGNGEVHATGDGLPWIIEWKAGVEFYDGAGQFAGGPRVFFVAGTQEDTAVVPPIGRGEMNLKPEALDAFLYVIDELIPEPEPEGPPLADVTTPGDAVKGVPDDGDWPGAEHPALAIDDDTGTKYLHFKGDFSPDPGTGGTGIQVTPVIGATIVTGITLTTANDVPGRDPIAFELSGSNDSIDGPYTLIAAGDVVDFAQEAEWPRFTKNTTEIAFDNAAAYEHYQIIFTAIRGPVGGSVNSMQIAEIELLGVKAPVMPADVTGPGDVVKGVPDDGDWPGAETPPLAVDDNVNTKYLHFKGDFDPDPGTGGAGIQITPAAGTTLVTGLTLTTANDVPGRDPIAFELSGSNVSIDGPYELIAAGDVVDFAQEAEWPRFTKNTTEIAFDNDVTYDHYQLIFTAIRGPVGGSVNSMQIAEIELIGLKLKAGSPSPADGAENVGVDVDLGWSAGSFAVSHDVYIGTDEIPWAFVGHVIGPSFDPGVLEYGTTYYWRVDEVEEDGTVRPGAIWSFTTTTPVGIFEYTQDIGAPSGIGRTTYEGYVWKSDKLSEQYLLMGGGHDVWDNSDDFHYAYNKVSGDVRVSANFEWIVKSNDWAKYGVMLRNSTSGGSAHRFMCERGLSDYAGMQGRVSDNSGSSEFGTAWTAGAVALGIQRVTVEGLTVIEGLADFGNGWESRAAELVFEGFGDEILAGVAITSHDDTHLAQARCWNVRYELNPSMVGELSLPTVPASADLGAPTSDVPGFKIEALKPLVTDGWGYAAVREIFDTGMYMGLPPQPGSQGTRISEFVNMRDTGNGVFSVDNGYPDETFPGIDPDETPAADPAAGDDDDNYGTQVTASIHLTAGLHIIGANSDDGTIIEIGGVEIGRAGEWKGTSNVDFVYQVEADGYYNLRALHIEGGGGSSLELHEVLLDGTRLLLNDVANGGSAVYAPAP